MTPQRDPRKRFDAIAEDYARYRPSYPPALLDWLLETARLSPPAVIADIGCGTGISARLFADRGFSVVGVDPSEAMLEQARRAKGARYVRGEASDTGLAAASVDLVCAGQAFHWFKLGPALKEFARILKPEGWCAAFWNEPAETPLLTAYEALLREHCPEYRTLPQGADTIAAIREAPAVASARAAEFPNSQSLDRRGFFGRVYASSYVALGLRGPEDFDKKLGLLFVEHQKGETISFDYRTIALMWRPRR